MGYSGRDPLWGPALSRPGGLRAGRYRESDLDCGPDALFVQKRRRVKVLDGEPKGLEQGDLIGRSPPLRPPRQQLSELSPDVVGAADGAFLDREQVIAGHVDRRLAAIDEETGG